MSFIKKIQGISALKKAFSGAAQRKTFPRHPGLVDPPARRDIPADFPRALSPYDSAYCFARIREALAYYNTTPEEAGTIHLAYPHKHAGLHPNHKNNADEMVTAFRDRMMGVAPHINWSIAGALCERIHLGRSENQTSVYALTARQSYDVYAPMQPQGELPLVSRGKDEKQFFIIVDSCIEQGTTLANMMSFITHNGGTVLMMSGDHCADIVQKRPPQNDNLPVLAPPFNDNARNNGRLAEMAKAFAISAGDEKKDWSPNFCMKQFEAALNKCGHSVFAMTDGECRHLIKTVDGTGHKKQSFPAVMADLQAHIAGGQKPVKKSFRR